ncbi:hypothetical protein ACQPZX_01845 [Actinoplanes sp. CA-142083]|uniref:hypothetical protein n=1 Tax=Actinoplanes sp. CA-142083 TaxID=3239903 RepID=UPI003D8C6613
MKPARSLAASVAALGFAGSVAAPLPAFGAPAPCERAESYAAQSGAELLRIDRLEVRAGEAERPVTEDSGPPAGAAARVLDGNVDPTKDNPDDSDTLSEGIGLAGSQLLESILHPTNPILPRAVNGESAETDAGGAEPDAGGAGPADESDEDTGGMGGGSVVAEVPDTDDTTADNPNDEDPARPAAKTARLSDVGLGEARTAMVGTSKIKSAAVARVLDGKADGKSSWTEPVLQQAPPNNAKPMTRSTSAGKAGPLKLGRGELSGHARWDAAMACGQAVGETARAQSAVNGAGVLSGPESALVRVPEKAASLSTTALEGRAGSAHSVASATVTAGRVELAGGKVRLRVLRAPKLVASMGADGGDVRYRPAQIEISGDGIATKRLDAAGESADVTLRPDRQATESGVLDAAGLGGLRPASRPLPLPHVPGLPTVSAPSPVTESTPAVGTRVHIELGSARRATKGRAIAARATAIQVSITQGGAVSGDRTKSGYGGKPATASLDLAFGLLEAAAVAPERGTAPADTSGAAGGLPITGPGVAGLAVGGIALLLSGAAAVVFGKRRRRSHS